METDTEVVTCHISYAMWVSWAETSSGGGPKHRNVECNSGSQPSVRGVATYIIKNNSPTIMRTKLVFQYIYIYIYIYLH